MAWLLFAAIVLPLLPETPMVSYAEDGGNSCNCSFTIPVAGDGAFEFTHAESVSISGVNQSIAIDSEKTDIIVYGDYYKENEQFNPKVGELYSGNYSMACKDLCLWAPKLSELPDWFQSQVLHDYGYAALYTGFMEMDNIYGKKPYGTTRIGETLGYDVYAANGEWFDRDMGNKGDLRNYTPSGVTILSDTDAVTPTWALINSYRAVGKELYAFGVAPVPQVNDEGKLITNPVISAVCGPNKLTNGLWDVNKSPVISALSGNIEVNFSGGNYPVVLIYSSRTDPECYLKQAETDALEFDLHNETTISCADFCKLVADLMHAYGEPVITEMEEYMLLEAYGRKLPYDLFPAQLDSVKYLIVRGIIDGTDELATMSDGAWDWSSPINFEQAATILMRVKDKGSRLTFKEFQLTTDLSLLKQGFYPVDVVLDQTTEMDESPLEYLPAAQSTHYDYLVRRSDNRALFLSSNEEAVAGSGVKVETAPHVSASSMDPDKRLPDSYFRGRTNDGWYWFQIPIGVEGNVFLNTSHAADDDPPQYTLEVGGGRYILNGTSAGRVPFSETDSQSYVDVDRFLASTMEANVQTAAEQADRNRVCAYVITVSKELLQSEKNRSLTWGDPSVKHSNAGSGDASAEDFPFFHSLPRWSEANPTVEPATAWVKQGDPEPKYKAETGYTECKLYRSYQSANSAYLTFVVSADEAITADMARVALNLSKLQGGAIGDQSPAKAVRAYGRLGKEYMVSVSYLKAQGAISLFDDWGNGKYFMSVSTGSTSNVGCPDIDVYIDCNRRSGSMVVWGSTAYIYDVDELVINRMKDDYYINLTAIDGKLEHTSMEMEGDAGVVIHAIPAKYTRYRTVHASGEGEAYLAPLIPTDPEVEYTDGTQYYMNLMYQNKVSNYICVYDMRSVNPAPVVYTLYETGKKVTDAESDKSRALFEATFGVSFPSNSIYYKRTEGAPEALIGIDGELIAPITGDARPELLYSPNGVTLAKVEDWPDNITADGTILELWDWMEAQGYPVVPYISEGVVHYDCLTNWAVSGSNGRTPVYIEATTSDRTRTDSIRAYKKDTISTVPTNLYGTVGKGTSYKFQPCGLPALVANFTVTIGKDNYTELAKGALVQELYFGCDKSGYLKDAKPKFETTAYITHYSGTVLSMQVYNGEITFDPDVINIGDQTAPGWTSGEANKITDWLNWLKDAKLEDAEDVLTIAIIAVLQWLPRLFMFIFFLLMGLSMIATMKPWVIFCDRYFDPYKFLTAGRMDVHTIEIKKVVLCSMIALVLFGFFQNGLILDIIAWCARAVTGILNR